MEGILIFIKHHWKFIWRFIEWSNGRLFTILHKKRLNGHLLNIFTEFISPPYEYRKLSESDATDLHNLINVQDTSDLEYFRPHDFDLQSIKDQFRNRTLLMMGVFDGNKLAGYFFLRFFANRQCFVGRLIDKGYRGKGIGINMNHIMYETAWRMGFRCLSTISVNNTNVMKSHANNPAISIIRKLPNNYLLVEFFKKETEKESQSVPND